MNVGDELPGPLLSQPTTEGEADPAGAELVGATDDATRRLADAQADRHRYGGTAGCDRCDKTLPARRTRLDMNAGAPWGQHWTLCEECGWQVLAFLRNRDAAIVEAPVSQVQARRKHQ